MPSCSIPLQGTAGAPAGTDRHRDWGRKRGQGAHSSPHACSSISTQHAARLSSGRSQSSSALRFRAFCHIQHFPIHWSARAAEAQGGLSSSWSRSLCSPWSPWSPHCHQHSHNPGTAGTPQMLGVGTGCPAGPVGHLTGDAAGPGRGEGPVGSRLGLSSPCQGWGPAHCRHLLQGPETAKAAESCLC